MAGSTEMICPSCSKIIEKSDYCISLANSGGAILISNERYEYCPKCGNSIDRIEIIRGIYDRNRVEGLRARCNPKSTLLINAIEATDWDAS